MSQKAGKPPATGGSGPLPDISLLSGIRCLCCLWILLVHGAGFSTFWPSTHPATKRVHDTPILGFLASTTFAVDVFWILSGFLCEYQLNFKVDVTKPRWYFWFMLNRLLRLWPLYLIGVAINFLTPGGFQCNSLGEVIKSSFFLDVLGQPDKYGMNTGCAGTGWTANVDVHGYLAILALFVFVKDLNTKKYVMYGLFLLSCILSFYESISADLSWPVMVPGLEGADPEMWDTITADDKIPHPWSYFPDLDPMKPEFVELRRRNVAFLGRLYFTSIFRHGAAMFLGCILAINLMNRLQKIDSTRSYRASSNPRLILTDALRLFVGLIAGYFVVDLRMDLSSRPAVWTGLYEKLASVALFCFIETMLVCYQYDNVVTDVIRKLLANRMWSFFGKFTYGIYLFHAIPMFIFIYSAHPLDVENGGVGADGYGWGYIWKLILVVLVEVLVVTFVLHHLLERPMQWFRYKYLRNRYMKTKKTKEV